MGSIESVLTRQGDSWAASRAARVARRFFWVGAAVVAVGLFLERLGVDVWWISVPGMENAHTRFERVLGYLALSFLGFVQGLLWLGAIFVFSKVLKLALGALWKPGRRAVAGALDRVLQTDRFASAVEASGPLADVARREALEPPPPRHALRLRPRRSERWLSLVAALAVLLIALAPGSAPGQEGSAPVAGEPKPDKPGEPMQLWLRGEEREYRIDEPIPLEVVVEAARELDEDFAHEVWLSLDEDLPVATRVRLFLPAGAPGTDTARLDLARFVRDLEPGEHTARAHAGKLRSNLYRFTIEKPPPNPKPPPPQPDQPKPDPKGGNDPKPRTKPKYVEPLVRDGEKVKKKARVPVETPGGAAPQQKTLKEAWPELEKRREAALNRPGLSPAARRLVREYFEKLRPQGDDK